MRLSIHVTYTEADIARLIREDLERRNLKVVAGDIKLSFAARVIQLLTRRIEPVLQICRRLVLSAVPQGFHHHLLRKHQEGTACT